MSDQPKGKNLTLDDLAAMMQREFTQSRNDMTTGFEKIDKRLDHIEKILLAKQEDRIVKLERAVQELRDALAM